MLFKKIAVSCHHHLYPGPEPLVGHGHGVPLKAPHQILNLVDREVRSLIRTPNNIQLRDATHKIVQWSPAWRAGCLDLC
jgi:hypothetical protein